MEDKTLSKRVRANGRVVGHVVDALYAGAEGERPGEAVVEAVRKDGGGVWSRAMIEAGFVEHRRTWDVEALVEAARRELRALGDGQICARAPDSAVHIWPHLPGAGLTPVLFGALLGVEQWIRPPRGAGAFARHLVETWNEVGGDALAPLYRLESGADWTFADLVCVSGSDATLAAIYRERVEATGGRPRVVGYGHRVSFGVVPAGVDDDERADIADQMARDAVLWHQSGCFSPRGVLVEGDAGRAEGFARQLGPAIARWEQELDAVPDEEGCGDWWAERADKRGLADFRGARFGEGFGWAELRGEAFGGDQPLPHVVTVHPVGGPQELGAALEVAPEHLQGAALAGVADAQERVGATRRWIDALAAAGVTRICPPGLLQSPPAGWWHDGRPNLMRWVGVTTID